MFDLVFIALLYLASDGTYSMEAFPNQAPVTMEECQGAIPDIVANIKKEHPDVQVQGWCFKESWPFPPPKQPKGSI